MVALEAIRGVKSIQEIARERGLHPVQVSEWKKAMIEGASEAFGASRGGGKEQEVEKERERLHAKIGELSVQVDWLKKKCKQLGLPSD